MKVCDYCHTAIYCDKESALRAGSKSMDLPPSTRFKVGGHGKIKGTAFIVLGRLVYAHEKGTWNEWFIEMESGEIQWLTEDEGELFLEKPFKLREQVPSHEELKPGMRIPINDLVGVIEEIGTARCIGGEGQIPFQVEIGATYPYADGAGEDGSFSFGLEYDSATGVPSAYIGKILSIRAAESKPEAKAAPIARTGEVVRCTSCGEPYEGRRVETTEMVVCEACGAGLKLDEAETRVVGQNVGDRPPFTFSVGWPLNIEKSGYEVMGRLYYVETEEGREYGSFEYVLYHPDKGYLWLSEENGHFTVSRPMHRRVAVPPIPIRKMKVLVDNQPFQIFETGQLVLRWVDGALPWTAVVGEKTQYTHLIKPPQYVDREVTEQEMELFLGRYVSQEEIRSAAPESVRLPTPRGVYSCQPYVPSDALKGVGWLGGAFLVLNLLLLISGFLLNRGTVILHEDMTSEQYSREFLTQPFSVDKNGAVFRLQGSAPVNNSWLAMDFAVVNADEQVVSQLEADLSYYHGQDSDGSWSEGATKFTRYFRIDKAGTYRLLVYGQGGSGEQGKSGNEPVTIRVSKDVTIPWYFFIPIVLSLLVMFMQTMARWSFEKRRWASVEEDSDE